MRSVLFAALLGTAIVCSSTAHAQLEYIFVYQGTIMEDGEPANGEYEFQLRLVDDLNTQIGTTQFASAVINEGIFQVDMDFGPGAFDGSTRYLEISVRPFLDPNPYTLLSPSQLITSTPVAQYALSGNPGPQGPQGEPGIPGGSIWSLVGTGSRIYYDSGNVGIGTSSPLYPLSVQTDDTRAIDAQTDNTSGYAIYGRATATTGNTSGGRFITQSNAGEGVYGGATSSTGATYGGRFGSSSNNGTGVFGLASNDLSTFATYGGQFRSDGLAGRGVFGWATSGSGTTYGGEFLSESNDGTGVFGNANAVGPFVGITYGGHFQSDGSNGRGVFGDARSTSGLTYGVYGQSLSTSGRGVYGSATRISGVTFGVYGQSASTSGRGVYGLASSGTGTTYGVRGVVFSSDGFAGYFEGGKNYFEGNVGIGTENPSFNLSVSGTAAKTGGGSWAIFSDERLKKNIAPMTGSLDTISALRPVNFEYTAKDHFSFTPGVQSGFIAQDVQQVIPQWVNTADDGYLYLDQVGYEALIVDAIQELRAEKDAEIAKRDQQISDLQIRLERLERMMVLIVDK